MDLRQDLTPPPLDEQLVARLTKLAASIDCARKGAWEDKLVEFNTLAGTSFEYADFYEISGAESHVDWVRCVLTYRKVKPVSDVTRDELVEVIRRAFPGQLDAELYMIIFDANVPLKSGSLLIYYPLNHDTAAGRADRSEYNPTPEQLVDCALCHYEWPYEESGH